MDLNEVRELGKGVTVDRHGHRLSGASKLVYIVYGFDKILSDVDSILVRKGRAFVEKKMKKSA